MLLKLQNRALRYIYFSEESSIRLLYLLMRAGVLPLKFSYYELLANLMFETRHSNALGNTHYVFQDIFDIHSYNIWLSFNNNNNNNNNNNSNNNNNYPGSPLALAVFSGALQIALYSQFKKTHFLESDQKWKAYIVCLKELPKTVFKRKIKQIIFWNSSFRTLLYWSSSNRSKSKAEFIFLLVCIY